MKGKIAIVIANPFFSIYHENSAVSLYLKSIGDSLSKSGFQVEYFPTPKPLINSQKKGSNLSFVKRIAKVILPNFYFKKRFRSYFSAIEIMNNQARNDLKGYDFILEFSSYGGRIAAICKKEFSVKTALIYDSPADLQFKEMYGKSGEFESLLNEAENISVVQSDLIFCYSHAVKNHLKDKFHFSGKIIELPCIVWKGFSNVKIDSEKIVIGFIGSFLKWHKVELLFEAFRTLAPKYNNIELVLIGYGEEWNHIHKMVEHSNLQPRILMPGFVSEEELLVYKSKFTIGVMPGSNWYGSPLKLFEYAELGIPVIAPATPTVLQYFTHNVNAMIIDQENESDSLKDHLESLINDISLRKKLGNSGLEMMKNDLSKEKVMNSFTEEIQNLLK